MNAAQSIVWLPGLMCDADLFAPQIAALSDRTHWVGDLSVDDTITGMAQRVLQDAPFQRFALVGLSMGGIVAMEMLRIAPERVTRLALLDTNHLPDTEERKAARQAQIERVEDGSLQDVMRDLKPFYVALAHRGDPVLDATFMGMAERLGPDVFVRQTTALMTRTGSADVLPTYDGKSLVLCGEHDEPCPPERHRQIAGLLPDARLVIVPDAGHVTTLEAPEAVNAALADWLS